MKGNQSFLEWLQFSRKIKSSSAMKMAHLFVFFFVPHRLAQFDFGVVAMEHSLEVGFYVKVEHFRVRGVRSVVNPWLECCRWEMVEIGSKSLEFLFCDLVIDVLQLGIFGNFDIFDFLLVEVVPALQEL